MFSALFNGIFLGGLGGGGVSLKSAFPEEKKQNHFPWFFSLTKVSILDSKLYTGVDLWKEKVYFTTVIFLLRLLFQ